MNTTEIIKALTQKEKALYELIKNTDNLQKLADKAELLYNDLSRFRKRYEEDKHTWSWKKILKVCKRLGV